MPIAVFDIDGTLTDTMAVDVECFETAVREVLGVDVPDHWATLPEITDSAILAAACELSGHRVPDADTERRVARRVAGLLSVALSRAPERFAPIPGARGVFDVARAAGWRVAMATGAWRESALVKLAGGAIPTDGVPLSTSNDHRARAEIIAHAVTTLGAAEDEAVVYVGDGVWDGRAAASLGFGFVGVGPDEKAEALRRVGAVDVLPDLSNVARFLDRLEIAAVGR